MTRMQEYLYPIKGKTINLSVSIGIAIYPKHSEDLEALIQFADQDLEQAKTKEWFNQNKKGNKKNQFIKWKSAWGI